MENNKKKILMMIFLSLFSIAIISLGTYAIWTSANDLLTGSNTIQSGQVKMSYSESNEIGMNNALPIKDSEGKALNNYFDFQVLSYIKTRANDSTQRKLNYNIVLEPINVDNPLSDSEIKVYLTKVESGTETVVVEPTTIEKLNNKVLSSKEEIFSNNKGEVVTSYRLRAWIDASVDTNKFNEKKYSYKFRVNINNEAAPVKEDYALTFAKSKVGTDGLEPITHTIDNTLQVDNKFATEYRYRGGDSVVKNYVTFNNEVWRIIGIIPTEDTNGKVENRIKIIRDTSIGNKYWNTTQDTTTNSKNNWVTGTLNTYLNNDYYNTLTTDAKSMIGTTKYYLGGYSSLSITSDIIWQYERKKSNGSECDYPFNYNECYFYKTNPIMQNDANKKIALMYFSDYGYAASKECTSNFNIYSGSQSCVTTNNWLGKSAKTWLLTQSSDEDYYAFMVDAYGGVSSADVNRYEFAVRPVLSLSSNVKISGGEGTSQKPYMLSIS